MIIRKTEIKDVEEVAHIYDIARAFMSSTGNKKQWSSGHPNGEDVLRDLKDGNSFVIVDGEEIIGTFFFKFGNDKTYNKIYNGDWLNQAPYAVIHRVAVKYQGRGLIREVFEFCSAFSDNLKIDTHKDNIPMQKALEKNHFQKCGIIYLENGEERIAYQRENRKVL